MKTHVLFKKSKDNLRPLDPQYKKNYKYWNPANSPKQKVSRKDYYSYLLRSILRKFKRNKCCLDHFSLRQGDAQTQLNAVKNTDALTWLGHAGFLLQLDSYNILCDPFMSKRASPLQWFGPKRLGREVLRIDDLPKIDIILLTHNHYDHLCARTLQEIRKKKGDAIVIVPLGLSNLLRSFGYKDVYELDWMDTVVIEGLQIQALPAIHWTKRCFQRINETLWCGFRLLSSKHHIYIAGDTAYGSIFKEISKLCDPFDYALLPIGGYEPRIIMRAHHVSPTEAAQIGIDIKSKTIVAKHWGTLNLTHEPLDAPPKSFYDEAIKRGYTDSNIWIMKIGETRPLIKTAA